MNHYNQEQSLGHLTGLASRLFNRLLASRFRQAGIEITAEQWGVILLLQNQAPLTQGQISEKLYLEKSSVSRSVNGLEKNGWVERQVSVEDSRRKMVALTSKSLAVVAQCQSIAEGVLIDAQQGLAEAELNQSKQQLGDLIVNLRSLNGQAASSNIDK